MILLGYNPFKNARIKAVSRKWDLDNRKMESKLSKKTNAYLGKDL